MKKILSFAFLMVFVAVNCYGQIDFGEMQKQMYGTRYTIVGKGSSGSIQCSGYIIEKPYALGATFKIYLSDMLEQSFSPMQKTQVDERTIKYTGGGGWEPQYEITKYKCPYGENVYFFTFPPLYDGQGYTTYKAVLK